MGRKVKGPEFVPGISVQYEFEKDGDIVPSKIEYVLEDGD